MQKRNDYVRYKTLRKINRRRKADQEKQSKIAEKELKRILRITPLKIYEEGKNSGYVLNNGNPISFDEYGNLVDQVTNNIENKIYKSGKNNVIYPMLTDSNYDQIRAIELGYKQNLNDHYPTRDYITGDILKYPMHPTFIKGLIEDAKLGYYPSIKHKPGRSNTQTWKGNDYINNKFNFYQ